MSPWNDSRIGLRRCTGKAKFGIRNSELPAAPQIPQLARSVRSLGMTAPICHPDRGPFRPERRDLWKGKWWGALLWLEGRCDTGAIAGDDHQLALPDLESLQSELDDVGSGREVEIYRRRDHEIRDLVPYAAVRNATRVAPSRILLNCSNGGPRRIMLASRQMTTSIQPPAVSRSRSGRGLCANEE